MITLFEVMRELAKDGKDVTIRSLDNGMIQIYLASPDGLPPHATAEMVVDNFEAMAKRFLIVAAREFWPDSQFAKEFYCPQVELMILDERIQDARNESKDIADRIQKLEDQASKLRARAAAGDHKAAAEWLKAMAALNRWD